MQERKGRNDTNYYEAQYNEATKSTEVSLREMIASFIQATIDADQDVTADYEDAIKQYGFEKGPDGKERLQTVEFEMTDSEGHRQKVSIPKLSLLPLPVLHVSEATFKLSAQMSVKKSSTKEDETKNEDEPKNNVTTLAEALKRQNSIYKKYNDLLFVKMARKPTAIELKKLQERAQANGTEGTEGTEGKEEQEQNVNLDIFIRLQPTQLPNGMRGLLQEADNHIEVK